MGDAYGTEAPAGGPRHGHGRSLLNAKCLGVALSRNLFHRPQKRRSAARPHARARVRACGARSAPWLELRVYPPT